MGTDYPNYYSVLKDFISPAGIAFATLIIGYFITRYQEAKNRNTDRNSRRLSLIESTIIEITRLISIFDNLQKDPEEQKFFKYKNIYSAKPSTEKLQKITEEVAIFPDDNLRKRLLTDIDLVSSLTDDLVNLENYAGSEDTKFKKIEEELLKELRSLKVTLLKLNIRLDQNSVPQQINGKTKLTKEHKESVQELYNNLNSSYLAAIKNKDDVAIFCKEKRTFYTMQIVSAQARLRELDLLLNTARDKLINKKSVWHTKIF